MSALARDLMIVVISVVTSKVTVLTKMTPTCPEKVTGKDQRGSAQKSSHLLVAFRTRGIHPSSY